MSGLLTPPEVAAELGLRDMRRVREVMREAGAFDIGRGRLRLDPQDLRAWLEGRRSRPLEAVVTRRRSAVTIYDELRPGWLEDAS